MEIKDFSIVYKLAHSIYCMSFGVCSVYTQFNSKVINFSRRHLLELLVLIKHYKCVCVCFRFQ